MLLLYNLGLPYQYYTPLHLTPGLVNLIFRAFYTGFHSKLYRNTGSVTLNAVICESGEV